MFEAVGSQLRIPDGVLNVAVPEIRLQRRGLTLIAAVA